MNTVMGTLFHTSIPEIMEAMMNSSGPLFANEIAERTGLDCSGVLKILKRLRSKGLTTRWKDGDLRWILTPTGREVAVIIVRCKDRLEEVLG